MNLQGNARADLGRRIAAKLGMPCGYRPKTRAEVEGRLGRRVDDATVARSNRQAREQAERGDNPEVAAVLANTCAATVRQQGGDPTYFERRARDIRRHALRVRVTTRIARFGPRPRAPRARRRSRACSAARRGGTRAGPGGGEPPDGQGDDGHHLAARVAP